MALWTYSQKSVKKKKTKGIFIEEHIIVFISMFICKGFGLAVKQGN